MSAITVVEFSTFVDLIVLERISIEDVERIKTIKNTMFFDEYSGYSPAQQEKYKAIQLILSTYKQPKSRMTI